MYYSFPASKWQTHLIRRQHQWVHYIACALGSGTIYLLLYIYTWLLGEGVLSTGESLERLDMERQSTSKWVSKVLPPLTTSGHSLRQNA